MANMEIKLPLRELMSKSAVDSSSLPNSVLNREQANRFIDLVVNESVLLPKTRTVRTNRNKGEINKLDLGTIVTEGAHTTSTASTRVPTESVVTYDCEKYRSAFDLKTDFMEDNLERAGIRDTLLSMFSKRIAIDTELAAIEGDDSLTTGDAQTAENNLLGVNDGWKTILTARVPGAQQIDASGTAPSKVLYYAMKRAIPSRYRAAKPNYVWVVPSGPFDKWKLDWSDRETAGGDSALSQGLAPGPWGIPMLEVPLMPEDLSYGTAGTDGSQIWLTPLHNLIYFVQRDITIEFDRQPRADVWEVTIHFRVDFEVENSDLAVIANNVAMSGNDYTG
tara:strand:- start:4953 stop:5957 length:1005 start_codon:yes stop_codon:yes gene_type:complete